MTPERLARLEQLGTKRGEGLAMIAVHVELCTAVRTLMDERDRIVADTRRKVAEELKAAANREDFEGTSWHAGMAYAHRLVTHADQNHAIARGSGNGDSGQEGT